MRICLMLLLFLTLLFASIPRTFSEASSIQIDVSRHLDKNLVCPGGFLTVQLNCSVVGNITGLIMTERIPIGFKFVNSTSQPPRVALKLNETINEVNWLFITRQGIEDVMINYVVEVGVEVEQGTYVFEGDWAAVGYEGSASNLCPITEILVEKAENTLVDPIVLVCVITILFLIIAVAITAALISKRRSL